MIRTVCILFVLLMFAGCATPRYAVPDLDEEVSGAAEGELVRDAMRTALARRGRVYDLAWPLMTANAELCEDRAPQAGIVFADRSLLARMSGGLEPVALERLGIEEGLRIVHTHEGGPAHAAGLRGGMMVDAVMGKPLDDADKAEDRLREAFESGEEATVTVRNETYRLTGTAACDVDVKISTSQALNATAIEDIVIYTGLIRSLSDSELQSIIAHELAHVVAGHRRKYARNALVTGAPIVGPVVYYAARTADRLMGLVGIDQDKPLAAGALRILAPWTEAFEAEADYVGLYLFARAGGDLSAASDALAVMGREGPGGITVRSTHPLLPERLARHAATIREIEAKRAAGRPLVPDEAE